MRYDLVDIKLFVAAAEAGNLTRAAAHCCLSPSSGSVRIKNLEEALGVALFERRTHGLTLTDAGRIMLSHGRRVLRNLEQLHAELSTHASGLTSHVRLYATSAAIASFLPKDLESFLLTHPAVRVDLQERVGQEIVTAVAEGRADLGITAWQGGHPALEFHPYRKDTVVVVGGRQLWPRRRKVSFSQCLEHPMVAMPGATAIHRYLLERAAALGRTLDVRIQVSSFEAALDLVRAGAGIAIVPQSVLQHGKRRGIRVLTLDEAWAVRELRLCVPREHSSMTAHARELMELLRARHPG